MPQSIRKLVVNLVICWSFLTGAFAFLNATEDSVRLVLANDRLYSSVNKSTGAIDQLLLDGQDLLGARNYVTPTPGGAGAGNNGIGPYLDCYCTPSGFYTPGSIAPRYKLIKGVDSTNTAYGGIVMSETYPPTGQMLEQYWFLREGETGLHTFSRLAYYNETRPFLRNLQEFRTLFRPNTPLWTHLSTNEELYAPLPSKNATASHVTVQDATWYMGKTPDDPYVVQMSDYFGKYTFHDTWRDHGVHGMFADGSTSPDGSTFGAWLVMNTKDTYYGGPLHSDLVVDGIVYNYYVSNHHGAGTPNITHGFDRTFGPQYFHYNKGPASATVNDLRNEALQYASPVWNVDFYDSIAQHVPNYVPSSRRTTWKGHIDLPEGAVRPIAVLAQNGVDFQDNALDASGYQYWADVDPATGDVEIPQVKAGKYRLTVYAEGIFGQYEKDNIDVVAGKVHTTHARWREESAGTELWRIGTPDKSSGEYKHGYELDETHPLRPREHRIYWAAYDFPTDFPEGVVFRVGESRESEDMNYVHWSVFGGKANFLRPEPYYENVNNWTILFNASDEQLSKKREATLTIQLAGVKTAAGNTDIFNTSEPYANLPYTVAVNQQELEPWVIPYYHSSSCAVRSAVICYNVAHKFTFPTEVLSEGVNELVLSLPAKATNYEPALLPQSVYVQYDALRLEIK
ncbi:hypothetical protein W97_06832 [Coniosporium apollinis CBS 100218]|uniref:rhamnogalacturonan endolyase n=1 Tax=Coniosporium apollinis (strain CBS 100218) TaxID=1168221 RepID=R7Z0Y2_CONA1|nr:uncharacterized protein W97_06832 [Coniosporium apollinis CBS 100218]EON67689.1 hypothetical protein W97_06832 [Coniosporium apollinis CBS 100218]